MEIPDHKMNFAAEIGQMVSYAFLTHRREDDADIESQDSESSPMGKAADETKPIRSIQRKEAFVERLLLYLLKTELGPGVLLHAVCGQNSEGFEAVVHSRQARAGSDDVIPDFEIVYKTQKHVHPLTILLELKVGAPLTEKQKNNYRVRREGLDVDPNIGHLVFLAPSWQNLGLSDGQDDKTKSFTFANLSKAAREMQSDDAGKTPWEAQVALWETLEAAAEGMDPASPLQLQGSDVLSDEVVAYEMEQWLTLFEQISRRLEGDGAETHPVEHINGFSLDGKHRVSYESGVGGEQWGIDFGQSAYHDEEDQHQRSPIWLSRKIKSEWHVRPLKLGRRSFEDQNDVFEARITDFLTQRDVKKPLPTTLKFVGQGSTRRFEFAREILWSAMRAATARAQEAQEEGTKVKILPLSGELPLGPGLSFTTDGCKREVEVRLVTRDSEGLPRLLISVNGTNVEVEMHSRGQDYVAAVADRTQEALNSR